MICWHATVHGPWLSEGMGQLPQKTCHNQDACLNLSPGCLSIQTHQQEYYIKKSIRAITLSY